MFLVSFFEVVGLVVKLAPLQGEKRSIVKETKPEILNTSKMIFVGHACPLSCSCPVMVLQRIWRFGVVAGNVPGNLHFTSHHYFVFVPRKF